jgi:hypothetical protein
MDPPPPPTSTRKPSIHTFHHAPCSSLVLATTHVLSSLPRRAAPSLDLTTILPLPLSEPNSSHSTAAQLADENGQYSILLQTKLAPRATIIRREDGFEKRRIIRCGRCNGAVGYFILDDTAGDEKAGDGAAGKNRRVVYLLPGGLVETTKMMDGKLKDEASEGWWTGEGVA